MHSSLCTKAAGVGLLILPALGENIFVVIIIHCCSAQSMGNLLCLSNPGEVGRPSSRTSSERTNHARDTDHPYFPLPSLLLSHETLISVVVLCVLWLLVSPSSMPPLSSPLPNEMREEEPTVEVSSSEVLWEKEGRIQVVSTS